MPGINHPIKAVQAAIRPDLDPYFVRGPRGKLVSRFFLGANFLTELLTKTGLFEGAASRSVSTSYWAAANWIFPLG